jgi:hypothetical protein
MPATFRGQDVGYLYSHQRSRLYEIVIPIYRS